MYKKNLTSLAITSALCAFAAGTAQADGQLNLYVWADSIAPELIEKFESETGIDINVDSFSSNEDALTKLQAGSSGFDLLNPSHHFVKIMVDSGLLKDFSANELEAFAKVDEKWRNQWWDEESKYSIPMAFGTAGFTVNRDEYEGATDSWGVFFEPTDLQGGIANLAQPDEVVGAAQLYLGVEFCSEDPSEMKKVLDLLQSQKEHVVAYTSDNIENRIGGGEVKAHFWWDGNTLRTRNDGANVEYAMPKEGLVGWLDSYVMPADAANVENATAFINFMSDKDNATIQYNYYAHSSPVEIDLTKAKYTPENAPELFPTVPVEFSRACSPAAQELVTKVWTELLQ